MSAGAQQHLHCKWRNGDVCYSDSISSNQPFLCKSAFRRGSLLNTAVCNENLRELQWFYGCAAQIISLQWIYWWTQFNRSKKKNADSAFILLFFSLFIYFFLNVSVCILTFFCMLSAILAIHISKHSAHSLTFVTFIFFKLFLFIYLQIFSHLKHIEMRSLPSVLSKTLFSLNKKISKLRYYLSFSVLLLVVSLLLCLAFSPRFAVLPTVLQSLIRCLQLWAFS